MTMPERVSGGPEMRLATYGTLAPGARIYVLAAPTDPTSVRALR